MKVGLSAGMIQGGKSGVAQYVFALTRALLVQPNPPDLTLFVFAADVPLFEFAKKRVTLDVVPEKFRPAIQNILWHQTRLPARCRELGLDVIHVPSYRRMLWRKPCALVSTIHDLAPFHVRGKYDPARMFYGRVVARALARRQDGVIAISQNTANDITRFFGIPSERLHLIHNGIDHDRFQPGDPEAARHQVSRRWNLNKPFFLYVSRLEHPAKNHVRLIEAFTRFKRETGSDWLLALGGSDWHGAEAIYESARASEVNDSIRFLGFVPDDVLPDLYRAAGTMVYPSLFEGFGFPPIEAMACGCPVISSTSGSLAEVVAEAAERIEPEDITAIQTALNRLATDPARGDQLRRAGLLNARRFNWSDNARQVLDLYRRVAPSQK
ncbi:MAG: glycosyltransferase family 4 protein [Verrucomicrobia bacterium]|nr:glycosyltransferase family 4 protein [Verrucomicrobiota bacterium]